MENDLLRSEDLKLQKQSVHPVGVHHLLAGRPSKYREASVLRSDQSKGVALIVNKLRGRQMTGAAVVCWVYDFGNVADNRLRDHHLLNRSTPASAANLYAKR